MNAMFLTGLQTTSLTFTHVKQNISFFKLTKLTNSFEEKRLVIGG